MWEPVVMVHDAPSKEMNEFLQEVWTSGLSSFETQMFKDNKSGSQHNSVFIIEETEEVLAHLTSESKPLVIYGHGNFHHYTYGLCAHLTKNLKKYTYCQIDYHSDEGKGYRPARTGGWGVPRLKKKPPKGSVRLDCGSFVRDLKDHGVTDWLYLGCNTSRHKNKRVQGADQQHLNDHKTSKSLKPFVEGMAKKLKTKRAYVSMDLDVINSLDIATGYGQGSIRLEDLIEMYNAIRDTKEIIGADILGYCGTEGYNLTDRSRRNKWSYYKHISMLTYAILASHIVGRDYHELMKLRHWILRKHNHKSNSVDLDDLFKDIRI
jgi:hypothetical protein